MNSFFKDKAQSDEQQPENEQYREVSYISLIKCLENVLEINQRNQHFYVEIIRNLAEFIIFSEQNKRSYFDLFCEKNMMEHFIRILNFNNRYVNIQLI